MNTPRYQELLGRMLDDELSALEFEEFAEGLRASPERLADFQFNLVLWELFSQQHQPGRSSGAFVASCKARLAAEAASAPLNRTVEEAETSRRPCPAFPRPKDSSTASPLSLQDVLRGLRRAFSTRFVVGALCSGIAAVLLVGLYVYYFGPPVGEPILAEVQGTGLVLERAREPIPPSVGMPLLAGDTLRTSGNVIVGITFGAEKTQLTVQTNTELRLGPWSAGKRFSLVIGKLEAAVARQRPYRRMTIRTPQAEARVLGTRFTLSVTTNATRLEVAEGQVLFIRVSDHEAVKVTAGHYAVAESNVVLSPLPLTGSILREYWTNIAGFQWTDLLAYSNYPGRPDGRTVTNIATLEMPSNWADNYAQRLRGYIHPPKTGEYTFWIASKDWASLYLSPDENPANKVQMAHCPETGPRDWLNDERQQAAGVPLTAGRSYYFEVVHKAGVGDDHLAVAWQPPGGEREIIPGKFLAPFKASKEERKL